MKAISIDQQELRALYVDQLRRVEDIAEHFGCSVPNIRKWLKKWGIHRGKAIQRLGIAPAWNRGLTKGGDLRLAAIAQARMGENNPMHGKPAWNAGKTKHCDERIARVAGSLTGREVSPETRERMAQAKRGRVRERSNRWKGGLAKSGAYTEHRNTEDGRRMYAHRRIAETLLERPLAPNEHVHHIDMNEANNDPHNLLAIFADDHARLHGAIGRGECASKEEQVAWLRTRAITHEVIA